MMSGLVQKNMSSPVGTLKLVGTDDALVGVFFSSHRHEPQWRTREVAQHVVLDHAARELDEYFRGVRRAFSTPVSAPGTDFQRAVWNALSTIGFGEQRSYSDLAQMIGKPDAVRAVGAANGRNPLSIFVPCHRVVAKTGNLVGYAGGLACKSWLLEHERRTTGKFRLHSEND